jgi:hypothetical protein
MLGSSALALVGLEAFLVGTNFAGLLHFGETHRYIQQAIELLPEADRPDGRIFQNRAGVDLELFDFDYRTAGLGLRSAEADPALLPVRREGVPRVLFLGDSVTLGWGVDDEHTWVRLLEQRAAEAGRPIECLNAGHLQYNTLQEADWLAAHGAELAPDLVVLTFVVNDFDDAYGAFQELKAALASGVEPGLAQRLEGRLRGRFPGLFALPRLLALRAEAQSFEELEAADAAEAEDPTLRPEYAAGAARTRPALDRILALCRELGAELVVLDHSQPELPLVRSWCSEQGIAYHDFRFTAEEWDQDIRNSLADAHANPLGNRYLADKAEAALATTGTLGL